MGRSITSIRIRYLKLNMVSQTDDITADHCKYLETVRSKLLEHINRLLPSQSSKCRGVIWLGRSRIELDDPSIDAAEYFADGILYPVSLNKIISFIPKDAVLIEMMPHNVFQSIITKSLENTITLISLCKHGQENTIQYFLERIGDLYNLGFQPQISSLYPPVQFPVSRGTPMISPLVRYGSSI